MTVLVLAAKSALAALLLVAGGAKLADLRGFAATVRLFLPARPLRRAVRWIACGVALGELGLGVASLSAPSVGWLNPVIFAVGCGFVAVAAVGFALHRGRSCRCFGALSRRGFDLAALARSVGIAALAALATGRAGPSSLQLTPVQRVLLGLGGCVLALAAGTAARALAVSREAPS